MNYGLQEFKFEQGRFLSASIRIYPHLSAFICVYLRFLSLYITPHSSALTLNH
jgi:hypothetical protein